MYFCPPRTTKIKSATRYNLGFLIFLKLFSLIKNIKNIKIIKGAYTKAAYFDPTIRPSDIEKSKTPAFGFFTARSIEYIEQIVNNVAATVACGNHPFRKTGRKVAINIPQARETKFDMPR
jgi:hypothetical protein